MHILLSSPHKVWTIQVHKLLSWHHSHSDLLRMQTMGRMLHAGVVHMVSVTLCTTAAEGSVGCG